MYRNDQQIGVLTPDIDCFHQPFYMAGITELRSRTEAAYCKKCKRRLNMYNICDDGLCHSCREKANAKKFADHVATPIHTKCRKFTTAVKKPQPHKNQYVGRDQEIAPMLFYPQKLKMAQGMGYPDFASAIIGVYQKGGVGAASQTFGIVPDHISKTLRRLGVEVVDGKRRRRAETEIGSPCKTCGGTERYATNGACVACQLKKNRERWDRIRKAA